MNNKKTIVINLIESFLIAFAMMSATGLESISILLLCVFIAAFIMLSNKDAIVESDSRAFVISMIVAAFFTILYVLSHDLSYGLENKGFRAVFLTLGSAGLFCIFYEIVYILICKLAQKKTIKGETGRKKFNAKIFCIYTVIVFLCCIPFFMLNYPGVMTPDSLVQYRQILGLDPLSNQHPWIHTLTIGLLYNIGFNITGSQYVGIAFYTVFQMLIVSVSVAYTIECIYESGASKAWRVATVLLFILYPYNLMYAVTMWKDVLFSMAVLVFTVTLFRVLSQWTIRDTIIWLISGLAMCLYRLNGFYAYVLAIVVILIVRRKDLKKFVIYGLSIIATALIINGPIADGVGVIQPPFAFGMTIPLQQIGRVAAAGGKISDNQLEFINSINDYELMGKLYEPECEDPLLSWAIVNDEYYLDEHKGEFIKNWISIGLHNPGTYVMAMVEQSKGYWAPIPPQQTVFYGITLGYVDGLESKPVINGPVLIKINELLSKLYTMIPLYGSMYSMGSAFWIMIFDGAFCIYKRDYSKLYVLIPILGVTLSVIAAAPLVADLRYAYQLMVTIPFLCYVFCGDVSDRIN